LCLYRAVNVNSVRVVRKKYPRYVVGGFLSERALAEGASCGVMRPTTDNEYVCMEMCGIHEHVVPPACRRRHQPFPLTRTPISLMITWWHVLCVAAGLSWVGR